MARCGPVRFRAVRPAGARPAHLGGGLRPWRGRAPRRAARTARRTLRRRRPAGLSRRLSRLWAAIRRARSTRSSTSAAPSSPGRGTFLGDIVFLRGSQEEMWQKLLELQFAPNPREVLRLDARARRRRDARILWHRPAARDRRLPRRRAGDHALDRDRARRGRRAARPSPAADRAAPRRLHRGGRRCCSSMPASIRASRSSCRATCSGGAAATPRARRALRRLSPRRARL